MSHRDSEAPFPSSLDNPASASSSGVQTLQYIHPRRHPLFPTPPEAVAYPELVYSDHLLILVEVPVAPGRTLKIVSLNTLGPSTGASGFHERSGWEDEEGAGRYARIAQGLGNAVRLHGAEVICLQEIPTEDRAYIVNFLKEALGEDWGVETNGKDGMVTCYNKRNLTLNSSECRTLQGRDRIHTLKLKDEEGRGIIIHNVWGQFDHSPHYKERQTQTLLSQDQDPEYPVKVEVGDTNSRIAPVLGSPEDTEHNIVTGVIPLTSNRLLDDGVQSTMQRTDFPDGGFYSDAQGIHQLSRQILHFATGEVVRDERSLAELEIWPEYRMVMCLDESYKTTPVIHGRTILDYDAYLKQHCGPDTVARVAANSVNQKAVGIRFPSHSPVFQKIVEQQLSLETEHGFRFENYASDYSSQPHGFLFAPMAKVELLYEVVNSAILKLNPNGYHAQLVGMITVPLNILRNRPSWTLGFYNQPSIPKKQMLEALIDDIMRVPRNSDPQHFLNIVNQYATQNAAIIDQKYFSFLPGETNTRRLFNQLITGLERAVAQIAQQSAASPAPSSSS